MWPSFMKTLPAKTTVKIRAVGSRFTVDMGDERLHVLNENSLTYNLKRMGVQPDHIISAFDSLCNEGYAEFELEYVA
jgi:hypothetical protein